MDLKWQILACSHLYHFLKSGLFFCFFLLTTHPQLVLALGKGVRQGSSDMLCTRYIQAPGQVQILAQKVWGAV